MLGQKGENLSDNVILKISEKFIFTDQLLIKQGLSNIIGMSFRRLDQLNKNLFKQIILHISVITDNLIINNIIDGLYKLKGDIKLDQEVLDVMKKK